MTPDKNTPNKLGVDTGGTFTDFVWLDNTGRLQIFKQRSTPHDPSEAILTGIAVNQISEDTAVVHGSTVATNAILERQGAKTALITTGGFRDVLAIGRQNRPDLYALVPRKPDPLVPQKWRFEINERVTADGQILTPLNPADLAPIITQLQQGNIESIAICLLFSFLRPEHEQQIKEFISQSAEQSPSTQHSALSTSSLPPSSLHISLSSEILPEYREYERTSTTVINAYVAPLMSRYLTRLDEQIGRRTLAIMQSNGGLISAHMAGEQAARTALSGPAGGVVGAKFVAEKAGFPNIITFDMGGTSTDVALVPGRLPTTSTGEIIDLPLRLPMMDIHTVGAGGGSLGYVDAGGALHVGPESAGADPGPACYPKEGMRRQNPVDSNAAVTDANLVLGRLDADHFLGGTMTLDTTAATNALTELAEKMGIESAENAAWGVIQVANAHMERAIRKISVERGYDPRDFTLVPFGGAGPLHACELAENLQIPRVLIPPTPGVLSALGMLVAAPTKDYSQTVMANILDWGSGIGEWLSAQFMPLETQAKAEMSAEGYTDITLNYSLDMRYKGQSHELNIPLAEFQQHTIPNPKSAIQNLFHTAHNTRYGYAQYDEPVEIVTIRLSAVAPVTPPELPQHETGDADASAAIVGTKQVWFNQQPIQTTLYDRNKLHTGHSLRGPAIIFQYDTTTVIPPNWQANIDRHANLILTIV